MITELVLQALMGTAEWLLGLLPADDLDWPETEWLPTLIGETVGPLDAVLPLAEFASVLTSCLLIIGPVIIVFRLSMFVWFLLPVVK